MKGTVFLTDTTGARNVRMRLDLLDGSLIYLDDKEEEMILVQAALQVSMTDTTTGQKYVFIPSTALQGSGAKTIWYQVLAGEKFILFKEYHKHMLESKKYASSITEQTIQTTEKYFIGRNGELTRVKKPAEIAELAGDKRKQLLEYIDKNKLGKKEADLISLVEYYRQLK